MNLEHKEKQELFDFYAKSQGYECWNHLFQNIRLASETQDVFFNEMNNHIFNACDLVQQKALEIASDNARINKYNPKKESFQEIDGVYQNGHVYTIKKESITNENNLIK